MPTLEERLAALELGVAMLQSDKGEALQDIRNRLAAQQRSLEVLTNVGTKQQLGNMEMAENLTMLLGITTTHQREGKEMQQEIREIKARLDSIEQHLAAMEIGFNSKLDTILAMLGKQ